jgi:putative hydrolase of the HAD superfamily
VAIQAVVFDIGGVLEVTPRTHWQERWASRLGMPRVAFEARAEPILAPGVTGAASLADIEREVAEALRPRYRTGILSNSFVGAREREQALYAFEDMCDVIVYSHEVGWVKPDSRIYHAVCERLGCAPEHAVLLDDVAANIDGARAVGMQGVLFTDTAQGIAELETLMG